MIMEVSPLTQHQRPRSFEPKIARLYDDLFRQEDENLADSDGFWREFFLLKPDKLRLKQRLNDLQPDDVLHLQVCQSPTLCLLLPAEYVDSMRHSSFFPEQYNRSELAPVPWMKTPLMYVGSTITLHFLATYLSDFDGLPRRNPCKEVHKPERRHHCHSGWLR